VSLTRSELICTPAVINAFSKVDRGHFIDRPEYPAEEVRYLNSPFRNGKQHLSAPCIYATALEALELSVGCSFLNVCAGTGYFSALASQILGNKAVHHAIEIKEELVDHARQKLSEIGCSNVELYTGACQALSPETSMLFDRICKRAPCTTPCTPPSIAPTLAPQTSVLVLMSQWPRFYSACSRSVASSSALLLAQTDRNVSCKPAA